MVQSSSRLFFHLSKRHLSRQSSADAGLVAAAKLNAARAAVDMLSASHRVVGVGSGSTVVPLVEALPQDVSRSYVATSWQARHLLLSRGLSVLELDQVDKIDITFDGADDIDHELTVIKGGGACHLREKVVAKWSERLVIIADWQKYSPVLGTGAWQQGVPIEVVPCALNLVEASIARQHGFIGHSLRQSEKGKAGPVVTDNGNFVLDAHFTEGRMQSPRNLLKNLKQMTGVVEVGLFVDLVSTVLLGMQDGTVKRIDR